MAAPGSTATAGAAPSFDIGAVIRRVKLAYRPDGDGWAGGGDAYAVRASANGFEVAPVNHGSPPSVDPTKRSFDPSGSGRAPLNEPQRGAPARFSTKRIALGQRTLGAGGRPRVEADGHLAVDRGDVVEHLRNTDEGVELSFGFDQRPRGAGDLTVRLGVTGQRHIGETTHGHHYVDPSTGLGVRFGRATWIDAGGARTEVPVRAQGSEIELRVPASVIATSVYPAVLDPVVSPEIGMDTVLFGPTWGRQWQPAVAFGGGQYLVAWTDSRFGYANPHTFGARVAPDGTVLDPFGLPSLVHGHSPAIAFDGTDFLVVVQTGAPYGNPDTLTEIHGARVSLAGDALDPGGFPIVAGNLSASAPDVTFDGSSFVVAWKHWHDNTRDIHGTRVTPGGGVLDPAGILMATDISGDPAITFDGTSSVVAYFDQDVRVARLSPLGVALDPAGITVSPDTSVEWRELAVAFDGTNTTVAWVRTDDYIDYSVHAARVTPQGVVLDPAAIVVGTETEPSTAIRTVAAAFDGTSTLIAWTEEPDSNEGLAPGPLYGARLSPDGVVLDAPAILVTESSLGSPAIASSGASSLVAWNDPSSGDEGDIHGARVDPQGAVLDPQGIVVASSANQQTSPSIAFDGENYLVVWADRRAFGEENVYEDIHGVRITPTGVVLDPSGIVIAAGAGWQVAPTAVFDGMNTLVTWQAFPYVPGKGSFETQANGARVTPQGTVLDPAPLELPLWSTCIVPLRAASDGTKTLLVGNYSGIEAAWVGQDGAVGELFSISPIGLDPAAASGGSGYLVVWSDNGEIRGARLDSQGVNLDPAGFSIASLAGFQAIRPVVSFDGASYLVAWESYQDQMPGILANVHGARVSAAGVVLDPQAILLASDTHPGLAYSTYCNAAEGLAVAFDGQRSIVAWRARTSADDASAFNLHGAEVSPEGVVVSTFPISEEPGEHGPPVLASQGNLRTLVAYSRFRAEPPFGAWRVQGRFIGVDACDDPSDCASGFCVDNVCCDSACGGGDPFDCQACSLAAGSLENGICAPISGNPCDDGNACSQADSCQDGVCVAGEPVTCAPVGECHEAACDPSTGLCSDSLEPDGSPCSNGGVCVAGACKHPLIPVPPDGGVPPAMDPDPDPITIGGCGCRVTGGASPAASLLVLALGGLLVGRRAAGSRRRKAASRAPSMD